MENCIEIKELNKFYGKKKQALSNVNLTIEQGMFGLLGRNGAGKTTLMKTLATLLKKQSGIGIILLVLAFSLFMFACGCEITVKLIVGTIADAIFLGSIGLLTSAVTGNLPVSFMTPLLYYMLNITMKSKLGNFYLFAMMSGNYEPNIWLFISGIVFIAISILIKRVLAKK